MAYAFIDNPQEHFNLSADWRLMNDLSGLEFSSCMNSWVISHITI